MGDLLDDLGHAWLVLPEAMKARCVLQDQAGLAEGPHWWAEKGVLLWVDIEASRVGLFDPVTGRNRFLVVPSHVGAVVPISDGELLVATAQGFVRLHPDSGAVSSLAGSRTRPDPAIAFNDGKCDPWGRFWAGSMAYDFAAGAGSLWRVNADFSCVRQRQGLTISNGLAWSQDHGTLLFALTHRHGRFWPFRSRSLVTYLVKPHRASLFQRPGMPFRMACASMRRASCGSPCLVEGAVTRWDPQSWPVYCSNGWSLPCRQVTSCCFGGPNLDQLFVTTARQEMDAVAIKAEPLAGGLFQSDVGVKGLACRLFSSGGLIRAVAHDPSR